MNEYSPRQQVSPSIQLKSRMFQALKQNAKDRKKSVMNVIKAYQFRFSQLFTKTIQGLMAASNYQSKHLQFKRLKNAIRNSQKDLLHSVHLIQTQRLRKHLNTFIINIKEQAKGKQNKLVSVQYQQYSLKEKMFKHLKFATLLYKLSQRYCQSHTLKMKRLLMRKMKRVLSNKKRRESKEEECDKVYEERILSRYFQRWKLHKLVIKSQTLKSRLVSKYYQQFIKCLVLSFKQEIEASRVHQLKLLGKCFNALVHNSIESKIIRYYQFKHTHKAFVAWKSLVRKLREEEELISEETVKKVRYLGEFSLKLTWLNRMMREFQRRTTNRQKDEAVRGYYNLKSEEIIYKKYFYAFVENRNLSRAQRHYSLRLQTKTWQAFKLSLISRRRANVLAKKANEFQAKRLVAKSFTILMIPVQKSRTALEWRKLYTKKLYLQKWIRSAVENYIQKQQRSTKFYKLNMYFRVLLGLKLNIEFNLKVMDVIRMRIRHRMGLWRHQHRLKQFVRDKELMLLATVFRTWKFYIRY